MQENTQIAPLDVPICLAFSEITIKTPGWYFFYPKHPDRFERPKFVEVDQDSIDGGWLQCRKYTGTYMGPIVTPSLPNVQDDESPPSTPPRQETAAGQGLA